VIENGNSFKLAAQTTTNADGASTSLIPGPITTEENVQKKNDVKARSMLLMALPNKHLMTFNQYNDAKTLFAAIQTRFGGNGHKEDSEDSSEQIYENFSVPSTKSLGSISTSFKRLSLPSEWNTHVEVWRNKPDLDTMSFDDLYNNFRIVEQEVKRTASSSSNSSSQNMAFVSSPSSTDKANTACEVNTANTKVSQASTQVSSASTQKTGRKITINGSDIAGYDKSKVEYFNCHKLGHFAREYRGPKDQDNRNLNQDNSKRTINVEETSSKAMLSIDGAGFDWSYMNEVIFEQIAVLKRDISYKDLEISVLKSELEKLKQEKESNQLKIKIFDNAFKGLDKLIGSQITDNSRKGVGFVSYNDVPPPHTGLFSPPKLDLSNSGLEVFQQPEFKGYGPKASKSVSEDISNEVRESPDALLVEELVSNDKLEKKTVSPTKIEFANCNYHQRERMVSGNNYIRVNYNYFAYRNMASRAVLMKTSLRPLNTARPISKNLMEDMLPLGEEPKEEELLVKELLKLNNVLFTNTGCFILSPDFKLADESQVLLKVPRKNNMYSVDMKNIVPKESLTCLVAKATLMNQCSSIGGLDETSEILNNFIKEIENLVDKKVKIIRSDNGTEFKNKVMDDFCREKGIKREYNVSRTPQQNGIAKRRNRTLIEATRTMLADSKLPTTFWAEAVSTDLGKFDGKSDEGFFVGYSLSSKAFRVLHHYETRRVENLHIGFLENNPMIEGNGPKWLFDIDSLTQSMNYVPVTADAYTLIYLPRMLIIGEPKSVADVQKQDGVCPDVNTSSSKLNTIDPSVNTASSYDQDSSNNMFTMGVSHTLEATHVEFFSDEDEPEVDLGNITNSYTVPTTPNTRIHKDHPIKNVIGDVKSYVQTRRMTKPTSEQGFLSAVYKQKTHDTLNTCLYACFLSQIKPTSIAKALSNSSWVEAMQEELLQFKLQ
ncbi:putative ribonuclease H-like domain-containing protein, partial [Tanacetum coccineum]